MKIKYLELKNYKKFKHSDIRYLKWKINNPIQIIIGSNGSGKSSLIYQTLPIVPIKSDFKKGYKKLIVEYDNKEYILSADFSSNNKCHSFKIIKDNKEKELNIGMGADIQKTLIEKYFNLDQYKLAILMFNLDWANMTPSIRKQYLYNLNPIDLTYINKVFKHITKQLTKVNNNISLLHERKRKLKLSLLSSNEFKELQNTFDYINNLKQSIYSYLVSFETLKQNDQKDFVSMTSIDIDKLTNDIKNNLIFIYNNLNISSNIKNINDLKQQANILSDKIDILSNTIKEIISTKEKYELHLKHLSKKDKLTLLENELKNNQKYIKDNEHIKNILNKLSTKYFIENFKALYNRKDKLISDFKSLFDDIITFCDNHDIISLQPFIISDNKINKLIDKKNTIKNKCIRYSLELDNLKKSLTEISNKINKYTKPTIPNECISNKLNTKCSLFINYDLALKELNIKYDKISNNVQKIKNKLKHYNKIFNNLSDLETKISFFKNKLNDFNNIINNNPLLIEYFKICFNYTDNTSWFTNNIVNINNHLKIIFKELYNTINYYNIEKRSKDILEQLNNIHQDLSLSVSFIEEQIKSKTIQLNEHQITLNKYRNKLSSINNTIKKYNEFINYINILKDHQEKLLYYIKNKSLYSTELFYNIVITEIKQYLLHVTDKYNDISKHIKDQEFLKERLQKEVIEVVNDLYKNKKDLEHIYLVLKNLIASYNKNFFNKLITYTNYFLESLCSYNFKLSTIKDIENYDFKFKVTIGEFELNDISLCSDGQKDLLRLAINLSLLIILNLKNYPIVIDEIDKTFDETHKNKLLDLLNKLIDEKIVSQIFIVNHHAVFYDSFIGDYIVLNEANVTCPEIYNTSIDIE